MPRVSVLMPVRNAEATLDEAIASIRGQTFVDWELLVVDDGSTDGSATLLRRQARDDSRVRIVPRDGAGIVSALEAARRAARGALLARMDADDRSRPERLEAQVAYLDANSDVQLCGSHVRYFPRGAVAEGARRYEAWLASLVSPSDVVRDLWVECPLAHPSFMMRAAAIEAIGGYRDAGWPEDYDLLLRLWAAGGGLGVVPRVLLDWREAPKRLSRMDPRYSEDAFRRAKVHFLETTLLRGRDGLVIWGAGPVGKALARAALERAIPVRAFVDLDPRKIGQEIHGARVIAPDEVGDFRGALAVAAVGRAGARAEIRDALARLGWVDGEDFVAVA